ncbi:MAG: hypothetical protein R3Y12_08745 [Clostridia bacterium]
MDFATCNLDVLNNIYQNTSMGINSLDEIEKLSDNDKFTDLIRSQKRDFIKYNNASRDKIREYGKEPEDINTLTKMYSTLGMKTETFFDNSISKLSEMIIEGNTMGIIQMEKTLNHAKLVDESVKRLSEGLIAMEQKSISELKSYL